MVVLFRDYYRVLFEYLLLSLFDSMVVAFDYCHLSLSRHVLFRDLYFYSALYSYFHSFLRHLANYAIVVVVALALVVDEHLVREQVHCLYPCLD